MCHRVLKINIEIFSQNFKFANHKLKHYHNQAINEYTVNWLRRKRAYPGLEDETK